MKLNLRLWDSEREIERKTPLIVASYGLPAAQGQRTHSAGTNLDILANWYLFKFRRNFNRRACVSVCLSVFCLCVCVLSVLQKKIEKRFGDYCLHSGTFYDRVVLVTFYSHPERSDSRSTFWIWNSMRHFIKSCLAWYELTTKWLLLPDTTWQICMKKVWMDVDDEW